MSHLKGNGKNIKKSDGEPLTRKDVQYDLLHHIFNDDRRAFTDPTTGEKVTFKHLYIQNNIMTSPKSSKALKDKMREAPDFAVDFGAISLLVNVGRVNTTMSFFAEMKTTIRTYNPIPCLQRTNGSLQDAPRLKAILKASLLPEEYKSFPSTPSDILARANAGQIPPTSAANLIFVLAANSANVGSMHLEDMDFIDLFLPSSVSCQSRARAFLWLCHHYLESSATNMDDYDNDTSAGNPFGDPQRPGKAPAFVKLSPEEAALENVDPENELALAERLIVERSGIVILQADKLNQKAKASVNLVADDADSVASEPKAKASRKRGANPASKQKKTPVERRKATRKDQSDAEESYHRDPARSSLSPAPSSRFSPYKVDDRVNGKSRSLPNRTMTMVEHTFHIITSRDPLQDSDEEMGNEQDRLDYSNRLRIITRLRGKAPTPEPQRQPIPKRAYLHRPV
ncbi:hypothetical protein C8J56DRAFT_313447 [Mycena floridula]|nr:hypothetical protein C8J56DRAFT_313447 [Mycena floridula]